MSRIIRRSSALTLSLSLAACAAGPLPAALPAPAPVAPAPPADLRWRAVRIPQVGVTLEFPGVPVERSLYLAKPRADWLLRTAEIAPDEASHHVQFSFSRLDAPSPDRDEDEAVLQRLPSSLKSVDSRDPLLVSGFRGIAFQGTSKDGHAVSQRVVIAGRSLFVLLVDAPAGEMPGADARRFLESLRLDLAWSLVPIPDFNCTVAMPDAALPISVGNQPGQGNTRIRGFYLGGTGEIVYYVAVTPIAPSVRAAKSSEQMLDDASQALAHIEGNKLHAITPITLDGMTGRDVLYATTAPDKEMHFRIFIAGEHLYQVATGARTAELVSDENALRFLGSLRLNQGI